MPRPAKGIRLVRRSGRRCWYIADGDSCISTHLEDREAAQACLDAHLDRLSRGDGLIGALLAARISDLRSRRAMTLTNYERIHRRLTRTFGHLHPDDLTREVIQRFIGSRSACPTAARRELEELQAALKLGGLDHRHITLPPQPAPRDRFLTRAQANRLLEHCRAYHLRLWCLIAMTTGRRMRAILNLTWDRVDFDRGVLDFDEPGRKITKKRRGAVPFGGSLVAALQDARQLAVTPYVVEYRGSKIGNIGQSFRAAAKEAGVPWACPHVIKHSVISWLAEDGRGVDEIAWYTATSPDTVRRIYLKRNPDGLRSMADGLTAELNFGHRADYGKRKARKRLAETVCSAWKGTRVKGG